MRNELISVIVPIYKVEKYLRKCISSILAQTYKNLEIILVDDGSPDNCPAICDEFAEKDFRIKVIHKENGGLSSARNAGLDIATGDYIGFVDGDDYIAPEMYEKLYYALSKNDAEMAICRYAEIDDKGMIAYPDVPMVECNTSGNEALRWLEFENVKCFVIVCNKLFCSSLLEKIRFPVGKYCEDNFIIHEIYHKCKKVTTINDNLYFYLQRNDSILHATYDIRMADKVEGFYRRVCYIEKYSIDSNIISHYHLLIWSYRDFVMGYSIKSEKDENRLNEILEIVSEIRHKLGDNMNWKEKLFFNCLPLYKSLWFIKHMFIKKPN